MAFAAGFIRTWTGVNRGLPEAEEHADQHTRMIKGSCV